MARRFFAATSLISSALLVEKVRIVDLSGGDVAEQTFEMAFHCDSCARGIMSLDCTQNGLMLHDHSRDSPFLRQRQQAIAIDVHLHLLDQRPNSRIAGDFRNSRVKHFIRAMEGVCIPSSVCFTLTFQERMENQN